MDIIVGSVVRSKAGRDNGEVFLVLAREGEYAYLVDGKLRKVEKPKKKKLKHIQGSEKISERIVTMLENSEEVTNSDVRKALAKLENNELELTTCNASH